MTTNREPNAIEVTADSAPEAATHRPPRESTPPPRRSGGLPLRPWGYVGLLTVPLAVAGLITWHVNYGVVLFGDVDWYAAGLRSLLSDGPLYDPTKLALHVAQRPSYWNQAPSTALLTLVMLAPRGDWLWGLLMLAGVVVGLGLIWPPVGPGGALLLVPVVMLLPPVTSAMAGANVNGLVFGLLAAAWRFPRLAGWAVGIAAAAKLVPILAVAWLIGRRDWRGAGIALAVLTVTTFIVLAWKGPETLVDFIVLRLNEMPPSDGVTRWGLTEVLGMSAPWAYAIAGLLVIAAARNASFSLSILAMLASVTTLHVHYLTWLMVPLFGIWLPWLISHGRARSGAGASAASSA